MAPDKPPVPGFRLPALVCLFLVGLWLLLRAEGSRPAIRALGAALASRQTARSLAHSPMPVHGDPALGATLPLPQPGSGPIHSTRDPRHRPLYWVVVMLGECSDCNSSRLPPLPVARLAQVRVSVVGVTSPEVQALGAYKAKHRFAYPLVRDAGSRLGRAYRATWYPRVYVVSADGRLVWLQRSPTFRTADIEAAVGLSQRT